MTLNVQDFIRRNTCEREWGGSQGRLGEPSDCWKSDAVEEVERGWWKCPRLLYSLRKIWQGCWECSNQNWHQRSPPRMVLALSVLHSSHWPEQPVESLILGANVAADFRVQQHLGPLGNFSPYIW